MDFAKIFEDLKQRAEKAVKDFDIDKTVEQGKDLGEDALERLKTDRNAQIAAGAGGVLVAAMLGTKGGRRFLGGAAKAGAVAGLGALAYKAWMDRTGGNSESEPKVAELGFVTDANMDSEFAGALIQTMVAAAWADGGLSAEESAAIEAALKNATPEEARALTVNDRPELETLKEISAAAKSPNQAAQLYAAACLVTQDTTRSESNFLARLAGALGIESEHAAYIQKEVVSA